MATSSAITIRNLTLRGGNVPHNGGGLSASGNLTLENVRFENNAATSAVGSTAVSVGGALAVSGNLTANRCTFIGNQANGYGGAVNFSHLTGRITNSIFADNMAAVSCAAVRASNTAGTLTLLNNTFSDQYRNEKEAVLINGAATLQNNIFHNFLTSLTASGTTAIVSEDYNLLAAIELDPQALSGATVTRGEHDRIAASPRFVDAAARNYHLQANSPAIDLGVDTGVATDADGNARPYGPAADMGAYESQDVGIPSVRLSKPARPMFQQAPSSALCW
jgi:predicted outer membrane repeat protein